MPLWPCICGFLGALLLSSAWAKLQAPEEFRAIAAAYPFARWLPVRYWAPLVGPLEALLGGFLLVLHPFVAVAALAASLFFLGLATGGVAWRLSRGERRFRCGCGTNLEDEVSPVGVFLRNGLLFALAVVGIVSVVQAAAWPGTPLMPVYLTGFGLLLCQLLTEAGLRAWRYRW